jgi:hypothetical protein
VVQPKIREREKAHSGNQEDFVMRKFTLFCVAILCAAGTVAAQTSTTTAAVATSTTDAPQVGGGMSGDAGYPWQVAMNFVYQRFDIGNNNNNLFGIQTSVTRYINDSMFGVEGNVSAVFGHLNPHDREQIAFYGGGLHVGKHTGKIQPWAHALFGGTHDLFNQGIGPASFNSFGIMTGGGVDFPLKSHLSIRVEADYQGTHFGGVWQKTINAGGGLVINF